MFQFKLADALIQLQSRGAGLVQRQIGGIHAQLQSLIRLSSAGLGLGGVTGVAGGLAMMVRSAVAAEAAFAGVAKTTGASGQDFRKLKEEINALGRELSGITNEELRNIAQIGGQLGVPLEDIPKFTESIAKMAVAFDDVTAEAAANSMSELRTQFRFSYQDIDRVGSVVNELSNTTRATAGSILEVSRRLSGKGALLGISIQEVMALATSLRQAGVSSEVAGTSVGILMSKIANPGEWGAFAEIVGKTREEFGGIVKTSPFAAIEMVVRSLSQATGGAAFELLEEIELGGNRGEASILQLANAFDTLEINIERANDAFSNGTSIDQEYQRFADTVDAQLKRLKNNFDLTAAAFGEAILPGIRDVASGLESLSDHMRRNSDEWGIYVQKFVENMQTMSRWWDEANRFSAFASGRNDVHEEAARLALEQRLAALGRSAGGTHKQALEQALQHNEEAIRELESIRYYDRRDEGRVARIADLHRWRDMVRQQIGEMDRPQVEDIDKENWISGGKGGGLLRELTKISEVMQEIGAKDIHAGGLLQQVKDIPFLQERFGGGETQFPEPEEQRGGTYVSGPAQIWQQAMRSTFEKAQRNAAKRAEEQREEQRKVMADIRAEHGALLKSIEKNTKGGAKAG